MSEVDPRLKRLRDEARHLAQIGDTNGFTETLMDINVVRVMIEWPGRVAQRGNIEPYRFRGH